MSEQEKENDKDQQVAKQKPLEEFFNLPPAPLKSKETGLVTQSQAKEKSDSMESYDKKDDSIEGTFKSIHDIALETHDRIMDEIDEVDTKYAARNYEVAANYLNIALAAAEKRAKLKEHKDKLVAKPNKGSTTNVVAETITINTSELIKKLSAGEIIEGEFAEPAKSQEKPNE
jgi:replicative superfamily II helicase